MTGPRRPTTTEVLRRFPIQTSRQGGSLENASLSLVDHRCVTVLRQGVRDRVVVAGEIDVATAPQVTRAVSRLIADGRTRITVDLRQVTFMDASALGALVAVRSAVLRSGGSLRVTPNAVCNRLLDVTGLADLFASDLGPAD